MRRREFLGILGGAATTVYPLTVPALASKAPTIGFLGAIASPAFPKLLCAFNQGLSAAGYIDGCNLVVEYRSDHDPRALAALAESQPSVIVSTASMDVAAAASSVTQAIPILFLIRGNPATLDLVCSGRNVTGIALIPARRVCERLEALGRLVPQADALALLVHRNSFDIELYSEEVQRAASALGRRIEICKITKSVRDWNTVFARRSDNLVAIATQDSLPTLYRGFVTSNRVVSYPVGLFRAYRQLGKCAGGMLNGEMTTSFPVQQFVDFDIVTSLNSAARLGLDVPSTLPALADETTI